MAYKNKYQREKQQYSNDGGMTWNDVSPANYRRGRLLEAASDDCNTVEWREVIGSWFCVGDETIERWVNDGTECDGYDKYNTQRKQISVDGGSTWTDTEETRTGTLIEHNSEDCGYVGYQYRWVTVPDEYICYGTNKFTKEKEQKSSDKGVTWTDTGRIRQGSLIETDSEDCGYEPTVETRWVVIEGQYECVGYDKHTKEKKQQSTDGGQTWTDVVPTETRTGSVIEYNSEDCGYVPPSPDPSDYSTQYFTIEALTDGDISFQTSVIGTHAPTYISYSGDNGHIWHRIQAQYNTINIGNVAAGEKILFKGNNSHYANVYQSGYRYCFLKTTGRAKIYGNIMSLIYGDNFVGKTTLTEDLTFYRFFSGNYVDAQNIILPATALTNGCYAEMFSYCTSLTTAPELPATTLANRCYNQMFRNCTSLTTAPSLPATTLANYCYAGMFYGCSNLTAAPELPATTLTSYCYNYMFYNCSNLNYIKAMFTTTPGTSYTDNWVRNVSATGTFVKNSEATWTTRGVNGIPNGWTVVDET